MMTKEFDNFAVMIDYAVTWRGINLRAFYNRFLQSGIDKAMEMGHPYFLHGMSGIELASRVMENTGGSLPLDGNYAFPYDEPEYYWAGWALAQYRKHRGVSFRSLDENGLPIEKVVALFHPLHEADISKFFEVADTYYHPPKCRLKALRKAAGLTQQILSQESGVSLRMIRAYEQGAQPIGRASVESLIHLAQALCCAPEALLGV